MKRAIVLWLLLVAPAWADPPIAHIDAPPSPVLPYVTVKLKSANSVGKGFAWLSFSKGLSGGSVNGDREYWFTGPPGEYQVALIVSADNILATDQVTVVIGVPPPPVPPGPVPPGPLPPTPIPGDGFRVLIVYETADLGKLPKAQELVLYSQTVRDYLAAKCAVGPDNKTKEWRLWDKDVSTAGESKTWQDSMKLPRTGLPWIIIGSPKGGFSGPLPTTVDETMTLLKKFGE